MKQRLIKSVRDVRNLRVQYSHGDWKLESDVTASEYKACLFWAEIAREKLLVSADKVLHIFVVFSSLFLLPCDATRLYCLI
jgi:hypothetical protein